MKRSARVLGLGLALLLFSLALGAVLSYVVATDAFPDLVDRRMVMMVGFGVAVLLLVAIICVCTGVVRAAAAIDRIADETQVFGRWTRLAGSEFPASAMKNGRQPAKRGSESRGAESGGATQRHARPSTSAVPAVRHATGAISRVETVHAGQQPELDEHQRKLVAQYRAERAR